tara:strand:+ start:606 stop:716 length:111 start_codon:yes stop_codon:yes gene_type:complete
VANISAMRNDTLTLGEWKKAREEEEERMRKEEEEEK